MNNQAFSKCSKVMRRKKLDAVLRRFTGNRLTEAQRQQLGRTIGHHSQYRLIVERNPSRFHQRISLWQRRGICIRTVLGSVEKDRTVSAILIQRSQDGNPNTVCIYLPAGKEGE